MKIQEMNKTKRNVQFALSIFNKVFVKKEKIRQELESSNDYIVGILYDVIRCCYDNIEPTHQKESFRNLAEFLLWVYAKDVAYKDQGDWCLSELLRVLEGHRIEAKDPEDWYINKWHRKSLKMKKKLEESLDGES